MERDRANRLRWPKGRRRYDVAVLAELARLRPVELTMVLDGETQTVPVTMVAVGNTPWYGGGMKVCPAAEATDGLFDVTVVGPTTRLNLMRTKPRLMDGTHVEHPMVSVHRAARVELASPGVTTYADGVVVDTYNSSGAIGDEYPAFNELHIGGRENATNQRFAGEIDEVRMWDTERTLLEIQTNMNTQLVGNETGLLGNWRFD